MDHEARIKTAIEKGEIKNIVVIDDAFDPPTINDEDAGPLLDFLEESKNAPRLKRAGISPDERQEAIDALNSSEYSADALRAVVGKIYEKFVDKFEAHYDPANRFSILKGDNLRRVRPLLKLLGKCDKVVVTRIGSDDARVDFGALKPDAVFVDYYLHPDLSPNSSPSAEMGGAARRASLRMLRQVLDAKPGAGPSVMLMSSHNIRKEADAFRKEIQNDKKVFASRFQFMAKEDLNEIEDGTIRVSGSAADALLDIAQRHKFAGAIEDALTHWKAGVDLAVADIWNTITDLELKDYAYLARFRLAEEGQPLSSYLEWFFGEVLIDAIARSVKWNEKSFAVLDEGGVKNKPGSQIEGAFDGPTGKIAELYYRARVDVRLGRQGKDLRMGDVYGRASAPDEVLAVITPDCDLVDRRNKRSAKRLTVVAGSLHPIHAPEGTIADFFKKGRKSVNVAWNMKDIRSIEYDCVGDDGYKLLGTLRPLYAYELQRRVLSDLSRVGLAVAPAMAMTAKAEVFVTGNDGLVSLDLTNADRAACAVIPRRGGTDKPRVIYHRSFATAVLDKLLKLPQSVVNEAGLKGIANLRVPNNQIGFIEKLCRDGQCDGEEAFGILTSLQAKRAGALSPWCQILVSYELAPESDEAA